MTAQTNPTHHRLQYLDALRGLAILGVLSVHCVIISGGSFLGGKYAFAGTYGVQLFFIISAFTIFMTLEHAWINQKNVILAFYTRRFFRILPMFWVGIAIYAFVPGRDMQFEPRKITFIHYIFSATLQHGWHPAFINSIVPGGWTIAVEATFYIIAPVLYIYIKDWQDALKFLLVALIVFAVANLALKGFVANHMLFTNIQPKVRDFFATRWFPTQLPVFACGILTYYISKLLPDKYYNGRHGAILLFISAALFYIAVNCCSFLLILERMLFALSFSALLLSLAIHAPYTLVNPAICFLGRISYSFYLLHFTVLNTVIYAMRGMCPRILLNQLLAFIVLFVTTLLFSAALSYLTFICIEQPFIRIGRRLLSINATGRQKPQAKIALHQTL